MAVPTSSLVPPHLTLSHPVLLQVTERAKTGEVYEELVKYLLMVG